MQSGVGFAGEAITNGIRESFSKGVMTKRTRNVVNFWALCQACVAQYTTRQQCVVQRPRASFPVISPLGITSPNVKSNNSD